MARTKKATRQRPTANRSQLKSISKESFVASAETPITPATIATLNGTDPPNLVASEDGSPSSPTVSSSQSMDFVSQRRARRKLEPERTPYLASNLVGNKTRRIAVQEPGKARKTIMSYCVDCVRPHLWIYCDGTRALETKLCEFHEKEPNPRHWTKHYNEIRKLLDSLFQNEKKGGIVWSRPFTKPKLKHRLGCGHDKKTLDGDFDKMEMAAMKKMRKIEKKMAEEEEESDE